MNFRFYLYTSIGLSAFFIVMALLATPYFLRSSSVAFLESEIESSIREARQVAMLSSSALENNIPKEIVIASMQTAIQGTERQNAFLSVFDWSGEFICYPDITQVGNKTPAESMVSNLEEIMSSNDLYESIRRKERDTGNTSEVVYMVPIANSDWIVACHINIPRAIDKMNHLRNQFFYVFVIAGLFMLLFILGAIRFVGRYYEQQFVKRTAKLEDGVINLSKLNDSLENYQKNLLEFSENGDLLAHNPQTDVLPNVEIEPGKERILTYLRNELLPISVTDIAYVYVEHTITYVVRKDGKKSTSNESLDQLYSHLCEKTFFRANRQFIVAISAIDRIIKYSNNKLKIEVSPPSEIDIIIGKNKAAAFKQWLDM